MQVPSLEERREFILAPALRDEQHPLLRFREQDLVWSQPGLAQRHTVQIDVDPELAPRAISLEDDVRPAAPMSWIATIAPVSIASRHASISSFSVNGSPTWTVGRLASLESSNSAEASRLAPWIPSRPVAEPT